MKEIIKGKLIKFVSLDFLIIFQKKKKQKTKIINILPCCHLLSSSPLLCFEVRSFYGKRFLLCFFLFVCLTWYFDTVLNISLFYQLMGL